MRVRLLNVMKMKDNKISPTYFIIFQRAHDDYLGKIEESEEAIHYAWHPNPANALKFETFDKAEKIAYQIVSDKEHSYRIEICELYETEQQFGVRPVAVVMPHAASHKPESN